MKGRRKIFTDVDKITTENVIGVLQAALVTHDFNRQEIQYLYNYYRGDQPILGRVKDVRPEINNKIVENRAYEIVEFKVGYLFGEPIVYVANSEDKSVIDGVSRLNGYMTAEDKAAKDKVLADWMHICGTGYRIVLPDSEVRVDPDEAPFEMYTGDPRYTFVVYHRSLGEPAVMGVSYVVKSNGERVFYCYTEDTYFEIIDARRIAKTAPQAMGIPIIEYPANTARLGAFEVVLHQLDAINTIQSNRLDDVEQFVQALMLFHNVDINEDQYAKLREAGALKIKDVDPQFKGEVKYLVQSLAQSDTQTLVDDLYESVLTVCGMPNRNGGSSTSDTGSAVIMRDGWSAAEARAKDSELMFKQSEKLFLQKVLMICDDLDALRLKPSAVTAQFTRRNYENITSKADVLTKMLSNAKIHPLLAFTHCGMFSDPVVAYNLSVEYAKEQEKKAMELQKSNQPAGPDDGQGSPKSQTGENPTNSEGE